MPDALPLPPSLYADTARPAALTPPLDGDRRVSVAIVGGGFTGLSTALHLAEKGVDVVVLEANEPGWGASGRNGGQVNPGLKHDPDTVVKDFGDDLGGRMVALSGHAPNVVFDLIERHQIACGALRSGTLRSAITAKGAREIRASAEQWMRRGGPVSVLERDAIAGATGTGRYHAAMLDRRGGRSILWVMRGGWRRRRCSLGRRCMAARGCGGPARLGMGGGWETSTGTVAAERLVLATNGYTDVLWAGAAAQSGASVQRDCLDQAVAGGGGAGDHAGAVLGL